MRFANLPILQICLFFLVGTSLGFYLGNSDLSTYIFVFIGASLLFLASFLLARRFPKLKLIPSLLALFCIMNLGFLNTKIHLPKNQPQHYIHLGDSLFSKPLLFEGEIHKALKSSKYYDKYELTLSKVDGKSVQGKTLMQVNLDSTKTLKSNQRILGYGQFKSFTNPKNPQQFNYKTYMSRQGMLSAVNVDHKQLEVLPSKGFSILAIGEKMRNKIQLKLDQTQFSQAQLGIIQALILGQKQDISEQTYDDFAKAGVVHILAVSGLHVGIILIILQWLTYPLLFIPKGRIIRTFTVLIGIWFFAAIAGFSPSVVRAAVMFSFLTVAINFHRKTSAINTLALSLILLLSINPFDIFQVGFQLSYMAVFAIVLLQPRLYKIYTPRFYLDRMLWGILTVTITAQIGVLPLSLFYFHQFPGLFMLTNLVIIPFLGVLLGGGVLIIALSLVDFLPEFIVDTYAYLLDLLLSFIHWIAMKEDFIFTEILFTQNMLISSLVLLFAVLFWSKFHRKLSYAVISVALIVMFSVIYFEHKKVNSTVEWVIFNKYKKSLIGFKNGDHLTVFHDDSLDVSSDYAIQNYSTLKNINTIKNERFQNVFVLKNNEYLYIIDSLAVYELDEFKPDYLLLKNSPKINLDLVISDLQPKMIIADGSNYKTYVERWKSTTKNAGIDFHSTWEDGAFILKCASD
ncbi:ComEC/Rec2 family competence protein [Psychroflexus aestuariivivens]|uniref:ComEC/Rec2 family competence protein n=1 Tax=Psychroflexus aestuariivivens TaxID=1795040 RepID=UPI000FDBF68F|nr:ComEC/Rec2 family competence protein [Psychroflexus aestuariivivens]